jgi:hypothetical protein
MQTTAQLTFLLFSVWLCVVAASVIAPAPQNGGLGLPNTCPADRVPTGYTNKNCTWYVHARVLVFVFECMVPRSARALTGVKLGFIPPRSKRYADNKWWLPSVYEKNAMCVCSQTTDYNNNTLSCVRRFVQVYTGTRVGCQKCVGVDTTANATRRELCAPD